jgi:uncharacterized protein (TIGR03663 family)
MKSHASKNPLALLTSPLAIAILLAISIAVRWYALDNRPFHNDEGVNHFFITQIEQLGYYPYSHENYHGPSYFYWTYALTRLLGDSESAFRSSAAIAGVATILLTLYASTLLGVTRVGATLAALFLALLPSHVYYSRYAIHETLFTLSALGVFLYGLAWFLTYKRNALYLMAFSAAIHITTKETFIISFFTIFISWIGALCFLGFRERFQQIRAQWLHFVGAILLCILVVTALFTAGYRWPEGLKEMVAAVPQWVGRNDSDTGHFKPFFYYAKFLIKTEPWVFLGLALSAALPFIIRKKKPLLPLQERTTIIALSIWGIAALLVYSILNYKTPWLIINATVPLCIALGWSIGALTEFVPASRSLFNILLVILLGASVERVHFYTQQRVLGTANPFCYVHTTEGMRQAVQDIERYLQDKPNGRVLIGVDGYWPLPYYMRSYASRLMYQPSAEFSVLTPEYDVYILELTQDLHLDGWERKYYRLSDVEEGYVYFRR